MADTHTRTTATKDPASRKPEASADSNETATNPLAGFDTMQAFRQGALNLEHWISTGQDLTRFASYRVRRNLETLDAFAKCRTTEDLVSAVAKAASDTVHDYASEYDRVLAINLASAR